MANKNLRNAKAAKNDEFYTQLADIEKELGHYKDQFKNKVVFCNCDDPTWSNFWKYFALNFDFFGLKKLIATHYRYDGQPSYKLEISADNPNSKLVPVKTTLIGNGDFRSDECVEILKEADIVATNPPFSLFREFIAQLIEHNKTFVVIGNQNAISCKEIFSLLKNNLIWIGNSYPKEFIQPCGSIKKFGNICWFTNMETKKRHDNLPLYRSYNEKDYPKYDNYDAINIDKIKDIPADYAGNMGVPITFMLKYNPEQFEVIALGMVGSIEFDCNKKMEILDKKTGASTGKYTNNAKGKLYRLYNPVTDKTPTFRNVETGELYSSIYGRIIIRNKTL